MFRQNARRITRGIAVTERFLIFSLRERGDRFASNYRSKRKIRGIGRRK